MALAIEGRRVMGIPKRFQYLLIGNYFRIIFDLDDLSMPGVAIADFLVSRVLCPAATIAAGNRFYSRQHLEDGFRAPKAAATQSRNFSRVCRIVHGGKMCRKVGRLRAMPDQRA